MQKRKRIRLQDHMVREPVDWKITDYSNNEEDKYRVKQDNGNNGVLGIGAFGVVEEVEHENKTYARKRMKSFDALVKHGNEMETLKEMFEMPDVLIRHYVCLVEAYTRTTSGETEYFLVTSPVADGGSLSDFLAAFGENSSKASKAKLHQMAKCLVTGLATMHGFSIRHHDIHPGNILVHKFYPLFTDFGSSVNESYGDCGTQSLDPTQHFLCRAPEFSDKSARRDLKTDIFALGCILFDIAAILTDDSELKRVKANHAQHSYSSSKKLSDAREALTTALDSPTCRKYRCLLYVIWRMLDKEPSSRPQADAAMAALVDDGTPNTCKQCQKCYYLLKSDDPEDSQWKRWKMEVEDPKEAEKEYKECVSRREQGAD